MWIKKFYRLAFRAQRNTHNGIRLTIRARYFRVTTWTTGGKEEKARVSEWNKKPSNVAFIGLLSAKHWSRASRTASGPVDKGCASSRRR
ncbi:hypothetical protein PUN28_015488 [Cardiocondyla obscurior]|uniref:Uncharacterized protein n=1 Tax=Cardiocondyla obscurior TaxID=286306 RepID=A0AAW2ETE6_9HYME